MYIHLVNMPFLIVATPKKVRMVTIFVTMANVLS